MTPKKKKVSEKELVETLDAVVRKIAPKFVFGYHSLEDIKQEAMIIGLEGFKRYDGQRSLYNFLYTHVKNRLCNFKRKQYERINPPCDKCPFNAYIKATHECKKFKEMEDCELYYNWIKRNKDKKNIMRPVDIDLFTDPELEVQYQYDEDIVKKIEGEITAEFRKSWLKLKGGAKLRKTELEPLEIEIRRILYG